MGKGSRNRTMRRIGIKPRTISKRPNRAALKPAQIEARLRDYAGWLQRDAPSSNPHEARMGRN